MKMKRYLILFLFFTALASACKKDDIANASDFDKSYKAWKKFKTSSANSYRYMVITTSWTGYRTETILTIVDGKIVQRAYVAKITRYPNPTTIAEEWTETTGNLNSHQNGAATLTLEDVYTKAKTDWLLKREKSKTYFEANHNGMISTCGYVDDNCADDCFNGITIGYIEKITE